MDENLNQCLTDVVIPGQILHEQNLLQILTKILDQYETHLTISV